MSAAQGHGGQSNAEHETKMPIEDPHLGIFYDLVQNGRSEFVKRYPQFMYLQLLATHPNYRGQGYAKDLLRAYMVKAKQKGNVLTSFGGPFGYIFFSGLGFHDLGAIALPSGIASDTVMVKAMSLVVPKEARRRSIVNAVVNHITR
uniref:N-acetyltransferase domain-containing protein n=1 Tax=Bionectria ochroleuca TaxID=29856 RepID=A0A8H7N4L1_BIOOC